MHTLGAVQPSAPHFSGGAHCYEIYDVMCYTPKDGTVDVFLRNCEIIGEAAEPRQAAGLRGRRLLQPLAGAGLLPGGALEPLRLGVPVHAGAL